ncbi:hypothetical protein [Catenuloplanes atrovinosus]|uniref:TM2 domain-containing membrane protein YozV n=1 Tax=Catenuloplanes atrovinosus TaxID=137266 RepID=A0AAE3YLY6_9ACTN|nr:hypothetical protein [Catenuloplanes atrovinosus]MDR7275960.1 TM2 domain-containing membrane protein YozV [Catenuloplanes atrovinosus]
MNYDPEPHDPYAETARLSPTTPAAPWREPDPTKFDLPQAPPPVFQPQAPPPVFQQVQPYHPPYGPPPRPLKSTGAAVMLELFLGLFGLFGVGALYAGRTGLGLTLMISYWLLFWINVALVFVLVGFVTGPLTWLVYMIMAPVLAARAVDQHNAY